MDKVVANADEAIRDLQDGAVIMSSGFGLCGNPENLIKAIHRKGVKNLTIISNNCGTTDKGLGILLQTRQVRKMISSYVGENKEFERQFLAGELEVELNPQGTLAERIRAGGAGLGGFFTPTGVGTKIAEGKETRTIDGKEYVLEKPLKGDYAIIRAWKGDTWGNLIFRKTARNFSPMVANYVPPGIDGLLQSGNGMLGIGPYPTEKELDPDLINAGKETVTEIPGSAFFSSADSFAMIRGGHIDIAILGAMEVSERGDIANWTIPGKVLKGMGGAMDLVSGAKRVIVAMEQVARDGSKKLLKECRLPLTGKKCVNTVMSELAVIDITPQGLLLREVAPGVTPDDVQKVTEPKLRISPELRTIKI